MKLLIRLTQTAFFLLAALLALAISSCNTQKDNKPTKTLPTMEKQPDIKTIGNRIEIVATIVKQPFTNRKGIANGKIEYYVQRSIKDYYIKFCESEVTEAELEKALNNTSDLIKTLRLEVEIIDGLWDDCDHVGEEVQSRMGEYMLIYKIL